MCNENLVRFNLMISPEQLKEIDKYRRMENDPPSKGAAIRDLIQLGLDAYWRNKVEISKEK